MKQKNLALKAARYLIFETLEILMIPATAGLFLLGQGGAVYLFAASRETFMYQEILPGAEEGMSLIFIGLFLLAWIFVFYFWRRRAGLRRLIGQLAAVLLSAFLPGRTAICAASIMGMIAGAGICAGTLLLQRQGWPL